MNKHRKSFKIGIVYRLVDKPYGGINQFLKALKNEFIRRGVYTDNLSKARGLLFNSFLNPCQIYYYKLRYPHLVFIHRLDGPIFLYRGKDLLIDKFIYFQNRFLADGTIFQSKWSEQENKKLGYSSPFPSRIIMNAPDPQIFYSPKNKPFTSDKKIRLIANSWSSNWNKGFSYYQYLDRHLDFRQHLFTFVGTSPIKFRNIVSLPPQPSKQLAKILRKHDLYITASRNDACSNSLIEALHCGLPVVALNSGGHPEIVRQAGLLFNSTSDLVKAIHQVGRKLTAYQKKILLPTIKEIADQYLDFFKFVYKQKNGSSGF